MSRYCLTIGLFLGLLARSIQPISAAEATPPHDAEGAPIVAPAVSQAMQDRDYSAARMAIDKSAKAKDAPSDYLAYLRAWSLHLDKNDDLAISALEKFEKDYPQSKWLRRARFAKAQAMAGKGDFRGAQAVYESEAKYLLSDARRQQSAEVYCEFGDAGYRPPRAGQEPDYNAARQFYALALDAGLKGPRRDEVEFRIGICLQTLHQFKEAAKSFEEFLARHADDPRQNEVRFRLGECLLAAGKPVDARKAWKALLNGRLSSLTEQPGQAGKPDVRAKPALSPKGSVIRDWPAEAAFHLAETWHCPQPRDDEDAHRGVAALRDFLTWFPQHELAGQAQLEIAAIQVSRQRYDDAVATLQSFLHDSRWKDCKELPDALRRLGDVYLTQKKYAEALATWREYLHRYSAHEGWNEVQQSIIDTEYTVGLEKFKAAEYDAAAPLWNEFMDHYPLDPRNPGILYCFGEMQHRQKKWEAAIAAWQRLAAKYPRSSEVARAETMIARTLDEQLGRYEEAREHYRKIGDTAAASAISARQMQVATERAFRCDETPRLKLATRNVPSVKVRVYKIDLESYFRKMHSVAGVERLDVSLIDPDATFDFAVPEFTKYKPITSYVPVPLSDGLKAGVAAVTVSSPTQEATTLVIQSDLEIIVRAAHGEALVFAQNMRTGKPWPAARLLFSDGKTVFAEAKTGGDGFCKRKLPDIDDEYVLRVFAAADGGHVASTAVRLDAGPGIAELSDRIFVATDRAAYRTGEAVHVRGAARHAQGDHFVLEAGKKLSVELRDSADRRLRRQSVVLSVLGTFSCDFPLPEEMPEGTYHVVVNDDAGHHRTAQFEIVRPPVETARLEIDLPRKVYYRGETIEGTFRAVLPQDRRLADAKVEYSLGDRPPATVTTDARGEARFAIATDELDLYGQFGDCTLSASLPARELSSQRSITIATRGFDIEMSTPRPVFVVGEAIDVSLKTLDAANRPTVQKLLVKVSRQQKFGDELRELAVEEHSLTSGADGAAKLTLKPARGGHYTISASGTDRFGNTIEQSLAARVSDDEDPERLLLLADRTQFKAGDIADVQLYWRGEPATAVVTTHYDRLREHRIVDLHKGFNRLRFPVTAAMAPAFTLAASVMDAQGSRPAPSAMPFLCEAECNFTVDPNLQVKLESHRHGDPAAKPLPGEPIDVTVTTCDAQGKPLAAEVSLAALPSDRTDGNAGPHGVLPRFVLGRGHGAEFETASSITFHYRPFHRIIAADAPDADAPTTPSHVTPRLGAGAAPPAARPAPRAAAKPAATDNPFGDNTDDSFDAPPVTANASSAPKAAKPAATIDPFAAEPEQAAEASAVNVQSSATHRRPGSTDVACFAQRSWPGYWNPSITTGPDGRATVSFTPPDDGGELDLAARAVAADNLTGEALQKLSLKKDLTAKIHLPPSFTDGDEVEIPVVVHNDVLDKGTINVELSMTIDGAPWSDKRTLAVHGRGRMETSFKPLVRQTQRPAKNGGWSPTRPEAVFAVTTKAAGQTDVVRRSVPIRPYGEDCHVSVAGTVQGDATSAIAPSRPHWAARTLQIAVSPTIQRSLLDILDPPGEMKDRRIDAVQGADCLPAAGDLMAAVALAKLYPPQSAEGRMLDEKIHETLCVLIASQRHDGGWLVHGRSASLSTNVVAYWSLLSADKAGYEVPREVLEAGLTNLRHSLELNKDDDPTLKAIVLHALAVGGQGDFSLANQLLRDRKSLSPLGRAYLALALVRMDRKDMAANLLNAARSTGFSRNPNETPLEAKAGAEPPKDGTTSADVEAQAITALALLRLDPASTWAKSLVEGILAQRQGLHWNPENATGSAVLAATEWIAANGTADAPSRLTIAVNGKPFKTSRPRSARPDANRRCADIDAGQRQAADCDSQYGAGSHLLPHHARRCRSGRTRRRYLGSLAYRAFLRAAADGGRWARDRPRLQLAQRRHLHCRLQQSHGAASRRPPRFRGTDPLSQSNTTDGQRFLWVRRR